MNWQDWINTFRSHYMQTGEVYNDAINYGVSIQSQAQENKTWRVLGIHHLRPDENRGNHHVYIEALQKEWKRDNDQVFHWTWKGRQSNQDAPDFRAGQKPPNELVNLPLNLGMELSVWTDNSEIVTGLSSDHPDEAPGNTRGHHSFFVCFFQEIDEIDDNNDSLPEPPLEPQPPSPVIVKITANLDWLNKLPVNDQGNIIFEIGEDNNE